MTDPIDNAKQAWVKLMIGVTPEREQEVYKLWKTYDPTVRLENDIPGIRLAATSNNLFFNPKTMDVFWLVGFSAWRAIECYSPALILATKTNQSIDQLLLQDNDIPQIERLYKERLSAAQKLIGEETTDESFWPPDIPTPSTEMDSIQTSSDKASFDLTCMSVAFMLFHEFKHVMFGQDGNRPTDLREEELQCDVWARDFMTSKLNQYTKDAKEDFEAVLRKRSMGMALAAFTIHEITPSGSRQGCNSYFPVAERLKAITLNTKLSDTDHFWNWLAALLIGIYRRDQRPLNYTEPTPKRLAERLIEDF